MPHDLTEILSYMLAWAKGKRLELRIEIPHQPIACMSSAENTNCMHVSGSCFVSLITCAHAHVPLVVKGSGNACSDWGFKRPIDSKCSLYSIFIMFFCGDIYWILYWLDYTHAITYTCTLKMSLNSTSSLLNYRRFPTCFEFKPNNLQNLLSRQINRYMSMNVLGSLIATRSKRFGGRV